MSAAARVVLRQRKNLTIVLLKALIGGSNTTNKFEDAPFSRRWYNPSAKGLVQAHI